MNPWMIHSFSKESKPFNSFIENFLVVLNFDSDAENCTLEVCIERGTMMLLVLVYVLSSIYLVSGAKVSSIRKTNSNLAELSADDVLSSLTDWSSDIAFMTYRPNCEYCMSLEPYMESIAGLLVDNSNLQVGRFNCEQSKTHESVCSTLRLAYYPSIYFIGYGNMNQGGSSGNLLGQPKFINQRVVRYTAAMLPEAIYDWIRMLSTISSWQRRWDNFKGIFTGKSVVTNRIGKLQHQVAALQRRNAELEEKLIIAEADEIFGDLTDHGDVYPLLHSLEPDKVRYYCE